MNPFAPFEKIEGDLRRGLILVADHAMNRIPSPDKTLGLPAEILRRHVAYDIGVEAVTRRLAARLGAPAVMARFSRLLIDPNRGEDDPTLIMQLSDGAVVPGNRSLAPAERRRRLDGFHRPYHAAITETCAAVEAASGGTALIVSVHSFTPVWRGRPRPWQIGILWDRDPRAPRRLIEALRAAGDLTIGDNEPYDGALKGDTMYRHGTLAGRAHALIELRQDLIADRDGAVTWADRLAPVLDAINDDPDLHIERHYGSRTDATGPAAGVGRTENEEARTP